MATFRQSNGSRSRGQCYQLDIDIGNDNDSCNKCDCERDGPGWGVEYRRSKPLMLIPVLMLMLGFR
jgi:hypothetical protein